MIPVVDGAAMRHHAMHDFMILKDIGPSFGVEAACCPQGIRAIGLGIATGMTFRRETSALAQDEIGPFS